MVLTVQPSALLDRLLAVRFGLGKFALVAQRPNQGTDLHECVGVVLSMHTLHRLEGRAQGPLGFGRLALIAQHVAEVSGHRNPVGMCLTHRPPVLFHGRAQVRFGLCPPTQQPQ